MVESGSNYVDQVNIEPKDLANFVFNYKQQSSNTVL